MEQPVLAPDTTRLAPSKDTARGLARRLPAPNMIVILAAGVLLSFLALVAPHFGTGGGSLALLTQALAGFAGGIACFIALFQAGDHWSQRSRWAWTCIGISGFTFGMGWIAEMMLRANASHFPTPADFWFVIDQPLLWSGLFLLAWRGRSLGMMRLLTDTLIVVLSALVLSWALVLQSKFLDIEASPEARTLSIYYPIFDIAHLFCVMILIANVRDRPGLARAVGWLLGGVVCLIAVDSVTTYRWGNVRADIASPHWQIIAMAEVWSYILIGAGALVHANTPERDTPVRAISDDMLTGDGMVKSGIKLSAWDESLVKWHRSAMLWLPYIATLGVSAVLIGLEIQKSSPAAVQRLLPVVALLLAIVARQMLTLWDNLQLAERLRASNADLERNVDERTRHLATLHGITSTLNTSLDRRTVLRVTLEKTIAAVHAGGGGIWLRQSDQDAFTTPTLDEEWVLVHWQGFPEDDSMPHLLRDLAIAASDEGGGGHIQLSPNTRIAIQTGQAPPSQRLILVPMRWQGSLLGVMGLVRSEGAFSYEDRALVESVALEAGTALQNARLYSEASRRADRDSVTDLLNHRAVQEQLNATLGRCKRTKAQFAIVMMDLNNFKFFNDTYGHPVGDEVLRTVARALRESCRTSDILGRYGGDEFIALLPDTDPSGTIEVCQRIAGALDLRHFEPELGTKLPISISFGWAVFPQDGENALELLTQADSNLYNHKRGGASYLSQHAKAAKEGRDELRRLKNRAWGGSFGVLDALVTAIDNKDYYTRHHSEEVTYLSLLVAKEMEFSPEALRAVRISGLLHDVGKIAVPDDILRHPGKLGKEEWEIMQQHPVFGALIVKDVPHLEEVLGGIRHHHERWDGLGYPDKLVATGIPFMGRLLALADVYSALTTDRPYRKGWKPEAALEEIARSSGSHFDPQICDIFLRVMRRELTSLVVGADYSTRIAENFAETADTTSPAVMGTAATIHGAASAAESLVNIVSGAANGIHDLGLPTLEGV